MAKRTDGTYEQRVRWGIEMRTTMEAWGGPLGWGWMQPRLPIPAYADCWPASFKTRQQARLMAWTLTKANQTNSLGWTFRPVRLCITVQTDG